MTPKIKKEIIQRMIRSVKKIALGIATIGLLTAPNVLAQEMSIQSNGNTPVDKIKASCDVIRPGLRRLHTSDALLRVNTGQEYNSISARLMARLNSRLALNRIDSAKFVEIAAKFDAQREQFSTHYNEYEASLSSLIRIDCRVSPTEFYAALLKTRDARNKLSISVQSMNDSLVEYRVAVEHLKQEMFSKKGTDHES